jgi:hypothetical protein
MGGRSSQGKPQKGRPPRRRHSAAVPAGPNSVGAEPAPAAPAPGGRPVCGGNNGLTGIPQGIHWRATTESTEGSLELDQIAVNHFLDTLTQVALSIASRKLSKERGEQPC